MSAEGNSRPIGGTQQDFNEKPSLHCESLTDESEGHIYFNPAQAEQRPDLNGAEGGAEPLTAQQSSLIQEPPAQCAEEKTIAVSGPPTSSMVVSSVSNTGTPKEEPSKQGIKHLGRNEMKLYI